VVLPELKVSLMVLYLAGHYRHYGTDYVTLTLFQKHIVKAQLQSQVSGLEP